MISIEHFFQNYLKENPKLHSDYPGLKKNLLVDEFIFYSQSEYESAGDLLLDKTTLKRFLKLIEEKVPLEYINKRSFFYKNFFYVNENVLIPRFETELLVERSLNLISKLDENNPRIVDIGTGSGIIGLSIANELDTADIILSDICEKALGVTKKNIKQLEYMRSNKVTVKAIQSDRLENIEGTFDLIVSNPPYILKSELEKGVHKQSSLYEPHKALFLEDEEYNSWFEELFSSVYNKLKNKGIFYMEGHEEHLQHLIIKAKKLNWSDICLERDLTGRFRFLKALKE